MPKHKFSDQDENRIVESYRNGSSMEELRKEYSCGTIKPIKRVLLSHNTQLRSNDECIRKYTADYHYFDNIDTPNKAYMLGFLYADGCNYMNDKNYVYHWYVELKDEDEALLKRMMEEIKYNGVIKHTERKDQYGCRRSSQFWVCNHHMCSSLASWGVVPNKTSCAKYPEKLNDELLPHFTRGLLDGDGCIDKNGSVSICGTFDLIDSLKTKIENVFDIHWCLYKYDNDAHTATISNRSKRVIEFLDWIYKDADLKLDRKYNRYLEMQNANAIERKQKKVYV